MTDPTLPSVEEVGLELDPERIYDWPTTLDILRAFARAVAEESISRTDDGGPTEARCWAAEQFGEGGEGE